MVVYKDDPRFPSMSSDGLKKRGHCCRSACLHCPYGFTIKRHSLEFVDIGDNTKELYNDLSFQLWEKSNFDIHNTGEYKLLSLKNFVIGIVKVNHIVVQEIELLPSFRDQGISKELVESYYFY